MTTYPRSFGGVYVAVTEGTRKRRVGWIADDGTFTVTDERHRSVVESEAKARAAGQGIDSKAAKTVRAVPTPARGDVAKRVAHRLTPGNGYGSQKIEADLATVLGRPGLLLRLFGVVTGFSLVLMLLSIGAAAVSDSTAMGWVQGFAAGAAVGVFATSAFHLVRVESGVAHRIAGVEAEQEVVAEAESRVPSGWHVVANWTPSGNVTRDVDLLLCGPGVLIPVEVKWKPQQDVTPAAATLLHSWDQGEPLAKAVREAADHAAGQVRQVTGTTPTVETPWLVVVHPRTAGPHDPYGHDTGIEVIDDLAGFNDRLALLPSLDGAEAEQAAAIEAALT